MRELFSMEGGLFTFLSRIADLMILNIIFLLCCLPVITIGPALTAMFYITMKMVKNEECYIVKGFFKSFKENFIQAAIIWIIVAAAGIILGVDFWIIQNSDISFAKVIITLLCMMTLLYLCTVIYIFPVLAKFVNSIPHTIKNSFLISISNLPFTLLLIIILGAAVVASYIFYQLIPIWILCGFAAIAFLMSYLYIHVFKKYLPEEESSEEQEL